MIAFSCVHCGQRMRITEEDGSKKATCAKCGQTVLIPPAEEAGRRRRVVGGRVRAASAAGLTANIHEMDTRTNEGPPIHDVPTRVEPAGRPDAALTGFLAAAEAEDEIGRLGPYRILGVVGAGGMGVVFRAHDPQLDRLVALKAMLPNLAASATARQRFLREARAAARIQHDHVVTVYAVGEDRGVPYLAMPYLKGESLDARLRRVDGPLPAAEVLRIGREIAEGLAAVHGLGLVHRDIKPANVWLEGEPGATAGRVKILDFGLARATSGDVQLTLEGSIVGSPAFMAPEQASRQPVDPRADLFSLGCVMYMMATGTLPFDAGDTLATLLAVTTAAPVPPQEQNAKVPAEVSELVLRLLAKKPQDRPGSAQEVVEAIAALEAS